MLEIFIGWLILPLRSLHGDLELLKTEFYIFEDYEVKMSKNKGRIYWQPEKDWIAISRHLLLFGLRFPLTELLLEHLHTIGLSLN